MIASVLLAAAAAAAGADLPSFMTGCWQLVDGDSWTQECWMEPKAGLMLGASREGVAGKLKSWEQLRVQRTPDGKTILYASPGGRTPIAFEARKLSASAVEFVNPTHDFPQRIAYELKDGALTAEISLADGSKPVRWTYVKEAP